MDTTTAATPSAPRTFWTKWPLTTLCAVGGAISLAVLMVSQPPPVEEALAERGASAEVVAEAPAEATPAAEAASSDDLAVSEARAELAAAVAVDEAAAPKTGLYAMKGPKDAIPSMARHDDADPAPYGAAYAVGSDDADVWGGLTGTEVGEAYGVGGLGLVGTGRGGGGTGEGTIGLRHASARGGPSAGYGAGKGEARREEARGRYDRSIQARTLTAGTVDDNADPKGYEEALAKLADARAGLGIADKLWTIPGPGPRHAAGPRALDVALVIDTTGSMGDELEYLKVEIREIAGEIERSFPGVEQRWGLIAYRDHGDAYVTRSFDFTGINAFVDRLGEQSAGGGGDMPEAMDQALAESAGLSWRRGDDVARMVFLVADAPSHAGADARRFASAAFDHRSARTAIYPVAGSGVDPQAEAELRLAAKITGGHYIFLTDHSGVGGSHKEAEVKDYKVESLHDAMARMIRGELEGGAEAPELAVASTTPTTPTPAVHAPVVLALEPADAAPRDLWDVLLERLAAHFLFASSVAWLVLAAIGADSLIRRRRAARGLR